MRWLLIGSVAAKHWWPEFRAPKDIDLLTPVTFTGSNSQLCVVETSWHKAADAILEANFDSTFLDPDLLYTLKVSHAEWDIKWDKTMADIEFMRRKGCKLVVPIYKLLIEVWKEVHGRKRVNMAQSMSTFFNDAVKREHDHEYLHELVAFYDRPLHESLRPDHGTAWCDKEKFFALSPDDQDKVVLEETLATAIERGRLTSKSKQSEKLIAVSQATKKLITSMTTGWFALYLIINRSRLLQKRDLWLPKLNQALSSLS